MRKLLILRPEPGLSASKARAEQLGLEVIARPLFRIEAVEWSAPAPGRYDSLLLTSANAPRQAGPELAALRQLPAYAVGEATAEAAREAGLTVAGVGTGGLHELLAAIPGSPRLLHLAGEQRREADVHHVIDRIAVYRSAVIEDPALPPLEGTVAAVHSPRAGSRLAELTPRRERVAVAAISTAAADACGPGWEAVDVASAADDASLLALAASLCHTSRLG